MYLSIIYTFAGIGRIFENGHIKTFIFENFPLIHTKRENRNMSNIFNLSEAKYIAINENEYLIDVFEREGFELDAIPANCIFHKTLPGLGATYSEIKAKRNSVIIEPNVPVIKGKTDKNDKLLGVYEGVTDNKIKKYLLNKDVKYKKVLCTPESYSKVRKVANKNNINLFENYFCLFDECEKVIQDIDYREQISSPMEDFFLYNSKAFLSATPLQARHPKFEEQNFYLLEIQPSFDYKKKITLITTNDFYSSVADFFEKFKGSPCVCVFFNSTSGIHKLIKQLESNGIEDYKVFCSPKSVFKSKGKQDPMKNIYPDLDLPLARYNFFTSRFFSAVDILSPAKPDILILTDLDEAEHTKIDPFTNSIQIYGRFRNSYEDGKKFNSLTHISTYGIKDPILDESEIREYIDKAELEFENQQLRLMHTDSIIQREGIEQKKSGRYLAETEAQSKAVYNKFLDKDGKLNYFKIDNFYDENRVKAYYVKPNDLPEAYQRTSHFIINYENALFVISSPKITDFSKIKNTVERRKFLVEQLELIHTSDLPDSQKESAIAYFYREEDRKRLEEVEYNISAYHILGKKPMEDCEYQKGAIDKLLKEHEEKLNEEKMFSKTVCDEILARFGENQEHHIDNLTEVFREIFTKNGITTNIMHGDKIKIPIIERYYKLKQRKSGGNLTGIIQLFDFQPDKEHE